MRKHVKTAAVAIALGMTFCSTILCNDGRRTERHIRQNIHQEPDPYTDRR